MARGQHVSIAYEILTHIGGWACLRHRNFRSGALWNSDRAVADFVHHVRELEEKEFWPAAVQHRGWWRKAQGAWRAATSFILVAEPSRHVRAWRW